MIFDATGSYAAAFANGMAWNALNIAIMLPLLIRARTRSAKVDAGFATRMRVN